MTILAEGSQDEREDSMGAAAARAASRALFEAAEYVKSLTGAEGDTLLVGLQRRLLDGAVAAEDLAGRQLSAAKIREAQFAAGWNACLAARRGLHAV